jgi:hypothetical protein
MKHHMKIYILTAENARKHFTAAELADFHELQPWELTDFRRDEGRYYLARDFSASKRKQRFLVSIAERVLEMEDLMTLQLMPIDVVAPGELEPDTLVYIISCEKVERHFPPEVIRANPESFMRILSKPCYAVRCYARPDLRAFLMSLCDEAIPIEEFSPTDYGMPFLN